MRRVLTQDPDEVATFKPKLTVAIDPRDGSPIDAWLSPPTRDFLRDLSRQQHAPKHICTPAAAATNGCHSQLMSSPDSEESNPLEPGSSGSDETIETVEIPLTSDSEFFQILRRELRDLSQLHETEQRRLTAQITQLGNDLTSLIAATYKRPKTELEAWREIFRLYVESQVFFSTNEQEAGTRTPSAAQKMLKTFRDRLWVEEERLRLSKNGKVALNSFLRINVSLLQFMKFQEINRTALTKIMKKFDKRTALHAQANLPMMLAKEQFIAQDLAKAGCCIIQEQLLPIVPQIDDYLCPVCFSISFKPVRLRCDHVFCIRCLILMQRAKQDHCPLCRGNVVMEASAGKCTFIQASLPSLLYLSWRLTPPIENLDKKLMVFLQAKFPGEVKVKQKENQRAAGIDRYGEDFDKCAIM
jgi:E3 ubiquitin-protein ligase BAH